MSWIELSLVLDRARFPLASRAAFEADALGVEEAPAPGEAPRFRQPWDLEDPPEGPRCTLKAWFEPAAAPRGETALRAFGEVRASPVEAEDWAGGWREHHRAVVVSERLTVAPPWDAKPGDLVIPPGGAFGTGEHATTLSCLRAIDELAAGCRSCLDVGSGSGVLALAAARAGLAAHGVDVDPVAVRAARDNAALNGLAATFGARPLSEQAPADLVVANLYAEVLTGMAPELKRLARRHLVLAGILADRVEPLLSALAPLAVTRREREGDWVHLRLEPR